MATVSTLPAIRDQAPLIVRQAGDSARFAWEEFFYGRIRSEHTRRAYLRAVRYFLSWCENQAIELMQIGPGHVGVYMDCLPVSIASKKQVLAGLRHFPVLIEFMTCLLDYFRKVFNRLQTFEPTASSTKRESCCLLALHHRLFSEVNQLTLIGHGAIAGPFRKARSC